MAKKEIKKNIVKKAVAKKKLPPTKSAPKVIKKAEPPKKVEPVKKAEPAKPSVKRESKPAAKPQPKPVAAPVVEEPQSRQIGDKFLVDDGHQTWVGELISEDPLTFRKYHRAHSVQTTEDIVVDPNTIFLQELSKEEFYRRVA